MGDNLEGNLFGENTFDDCSQWAGSEEIGRSLPDELNGNESEPDKLANEPNTCIRDISSFAVVDIGKVEEFRSQWSVGDNLEEDLFRENTFDDFPPWAGLKEIERSLPDELNGNESEPDKLASTPNRYFREISSFAVVDIGKVEELQANPKTKRERTKYGTGIESQRTRDHKNNEYKSLPFYIAVLQHYGRADMKLFKRMAKVLEERGVHIERSAKRCKPWLVQVLSEHIPIESVGDFLKE